MMRSFLNPKSTVSAALLVGILICIQSGCASLTPFGNNEILLTEEEPTDQCTVRITPKFGQTRVETENLSDQATIQTVLESTGAIADFRNMEVNIFRPVTARGEVLRLPVKYDVSQNHVMQECNYAIHAGDTITVRPKSNSPLDKFVESVFGHQ